MAEQPTDVRSVLQGSQDVLDAAVATVTATRKTQNVLEQNIYHTKEKIDEHNVSTGSHEDIRQQLSNLIDTPEISGPNSAEYGEEASWDDDGFATDFRKVTKFIRAVVKEDLVYDCLQACKRYMSAQDIRDTLIKAAEEYVKTHKHPNQDDFTKLMIDHFKKQRF